MTARTGKGSSRTGNVRGAEHRLTMPVLPSGLPARPHRPPGLGARRLQLSRLQAVVQDGAAGRGLPGAKEGAELIARQGRGESISRVALPPCNPALPFREKNSDVAREIRLSDDEPT
jgi:hypothetical protein